jgi:hypothetical protein
MAENRTPRNVETRVQAERPKQWKPAELLPEPDKLPGYAYRWIRVGLQGSADPRNYSAKLREGWEPVKIEEQPQFQLLVDEGSRFKDCIEVGGLLLCKTPLEFVEQRNNHYLKQSEDQIKSVDNNLMRQNDPRMPLFKESKSSSSKGVAT